MNKKEMNNKKLEFTKGFLTGKYTQKKLAEQIGISKVTANQWVKDIQPLQYFTIRKELTDELSRLVKQKNYKANKEVVTRLITDIEHIEKLIIKAKNIYPI
jgi:DNA-binding XRE family transcriptional regulator